MAPQIQAAPNATLAEPVELIYPAPSDSPSYPENAFMQAFSAVILAADIPANVPKREPPAVSRS